MRSVLLVVLLALVALATGAPTGWFSNRDFAPNLREKISRAHCTGSEPCRFHIPQPAWTAAILERIEAGRAIARRVDIDRETINCDYENRASANIEALIQTTRFRDVIKRIAWCVVCAKREGNCTLRDKTRTTRFDDYVPGTISLVGGNGDRGGLFNRTDGFFNRDRDRDNERGSDRTTGATGFLQNLGDDMRDERESRRSDRTTGLTGFLQNLGQNMRDERESRDQEERGSEGRERGSEGRERESEGRERGSERSERRSDVRERGSERSESGSDVRERGSERSERGSERTTSADGTLTNLDRSDPTTTTTSSSSSITTREPAPGVMTIEPLPDGTLPIILHDFEPGTHVPGAGAPGPGVSGTGGKVSQPMQDVPGTVKPRPGVWAPEQGVPDPFHSAEGVAGGQAPDMLDTSTSSAGCFNNEAELHAILVPLGQGFDTTCAGASAKGLCDRLDVKIACGCACAMPTAMPRSGLDH
jgi:hypothetical protein